MDEGESLKVEHKFGPTSHTLLKLGLRVLQALRLTIRSYLSLVMASNLQLPA